MSGRRAPGPDDEVAGEPGAFDREDVTPAARPRRRWQHARERLVNHALVALGTVIGGVLRALVSVWAFNLLDPGFPWATLFANVAGSLLIGFYAALSAPGGRRPAGPRERQFVMSGLCGGFTTFSIFSLESLRLAQAAQWQAAAVNVGGSVLACLVAVWLGYVLGSRRGRQWR